MEHLEAAQEWRVRHNYIGRGGVIVVFDGVVQGWVDELRNPEAWRPGCMAVDETGRSWVAIGGNDQHGALTWMPRDTHSWRKRTVARRSSSGDVP